MLLKKFKRATQSAPISIREFFFFFLLFGVTSLSGPKRRAKAIRIHPSNLRTVRRSRAEGKISARSPAFARNGCFYALLCPTGRYRQGAQFKVDSSRSE